MEIFVNIYTKTKEYILQLNKSVSDFIPRRIIPSHLLYEKRSEKADESYRTEIQSVVKSLVKEYQNSILSEAQALGISDPESIINSKTSQEEQQVCRSV